MKIKSKSFIYTLFAVLIVIDQVTKVLVKMNMSIGEAIPVCDSWFFIQFIENPGAAFGMSLGGSWGKIVLTIFRAIAISVLFVYISNLLRKAKRDKWAVPTGVLVGVIFITAGATGNLIDSLFYGMIFSESTPYQVAQFLPDAGGYSSFLHGKVVDMLYFPMIESSYPKWIPIIGGGNFTFFSPIFNFADSCISCGFVYLLLFQRKFFTKK